MSSKAGQGWLAAVMRPPAAASSPAPPSASSRSAVGARHCWVIDPPGWPPGRWPALLHSWWRNEQGLWWATVTVAVPHQDRQAVLTLDLPASHLRPTDR